MSAAAASLRSTPAPSAPPPQLPSPFPSRAALALEQRSMAELEKVFLRAVTPEVDQLIGWEFRGINRFPIDLIPRVTGIKKFLKGFFRTEADKTMGYNVAIELNALDGRWRMKPDDAAPRRFGYYAVDAVDPTSRDNKYLHALLLDYSKGGNRRFDVSNPIRDYIVQVEPDNPDLYLGKAYYAVGPLRVMSNFFILERHRRGFTDYATR